MPDTHTTTTDDTRQDYTRTGEHGPEAGPVPPWLGESELDNALVLDDEALRILASAGC